ncbi:MAG: hypothetical protein ABIH72_00735 [archaeon]
MSELIVLKTGGTSHIHGGDIERDKRILKSDSRRRVMFVSAPGKIGSNRKVTDLLIDYYNAKTVDLKDTFFRAIIDRYKGIFYGTDLREAEESLKACSTIGETKAWGEDTLAKLLSRTIPNAEYVNPRDVFLVEGKDGEAIILPESSEMIKRTIGEVLNRGKIAIVPGFFGYNRNGEVITLPRGCSDESAACAAGVLEALVYENRTDVEGVYAANRDIVPDARLIPELTYKEMRALSVGGFHVLHPRAVAHVENKMVPIHIGNSEEIDGTGTLVVFDRVVNPKKPIVGIAYQPGFCVFEIEKTGFDDIPGGVEKILEIFGERNINWNYMPHGTDDISIALTQDQVSGRGIVHEITREIYKAVGGGYAEIGFKHDLGVLVVAGKGMKDRSGTSAKVDEVFSDNAINLIGKTQGTKQRNMIYIISEGDGASAVDQLYDEFIR